MTKSYQICIFFKESKNLYQVCFKQIDQLIIYNISN